MAHTPRILLVDDEPAIRQIMQRALANAGCEVHVAKSAEDAWAAVILSGCYDVLVTDVVLPGETGYDLAARIVARCPNTRVLLISGYLPHEIVERERGRGFKVLEKPFGPQQLVEAIRGLS
jgi:DNA-binding NtrC family response regulator